jgi:hypothetical protein
MFVIASIARQSIALLAQQQTLDCFTAFAMTVHFICNDTAFINMTQHFIRNDTAFRSRCRCIPRYDTRFFVIPLIAVIASEARQSRALLIQHQNSRLLSRTSNQLVALLLLALAL